MPQAATLPFTVDQWDATGVHLEDTLAAASNQLVARAAFEGAARIYPKAWLTLRHGIRVIAEHKPGEPLPGDMPVIRPEQD